MKITATFDSLEEFQAFIGQKSEPKKQEAPAQPEEKPKKAKKEEPKAEEPKAEEPEPEPVKKEEPKVDYDAMRVECRKVLSALNKATGKNTAQELIKGRGKSKLSEIEDRVLPALLEEAKEALEDAE